MRAKKIICIDFDGTCVTHEFPFIGKEIGAVPVLKKLIEYGHKLVLFTMRSDIENPTSEDYNILPNGGKYLTDAVNWFKENEIELFGINENPTQKTWTHSPKAYGQLYIDDAALGCPLLYPDMSKPPYAGWNKIHDILQEKGYFDTFTEQRNKHPEPVDLLSILREDCYTNDDINKQAGIISRKE